MVFFTCLSGRASFSICSDAEGTNPHRSLSLSREHAAPFSFVYGQLVDFSSTVGLYLCQTTRLFSCSDIEINAFVSR